MIRVAINGYGRIGRVAHRVILEKFADQIEIVAVNGVILLIMQGNIKNFNRTNFRPED